MVLFSIGVLKAAVVTVPVGPDRSNEGRPDHRSGDRGAFIPFSNEH
jgi:hypothetical protein